MRFTRDPKRHKTYETERKFFFLEAHDLQISR